MDRHYRVEGAGEVRRSIDHHYCVEGAGVSERL